MLYQFLQRKQWQPTPALLPGKSHGQRSLVGYSPWGFEELDTTERLHFHFALPCIGEGNGDPLQCSCLENPRDRGAWWAAVHRVAQSRTRLKRLSMHALISVPQQSDSGIHIYTCIYNTHACIFFFIFFYTVVYHRISCTVQQDLVVYPSCLYWFTYATPKLPNLPCPLLLPPWQPQACSLCQPAFPMHLLFSFGRAL